MRKLIPAILLVLAAGWAVAQEPARAPASQAGETKGKKELTAIVVSTDATVKTITVKKSAPGSQAETLPVAEAAVSYLSSIKAGEKVKLVLTMDPTTHKETVTSIEKPSPSTGPDKP